MEKSHTIRRPESLTAIVANKIRQAIVRGEFELGQAISENSLCEMYEISKTPIKLALVQLKTEGLVEIIPQKGSYVFTASTDDLRQMKVWRMAIESAGLEEAYLRDRTALVQTLSSIYEEMKSLYGTSNRPEIFAMDARFHFAIVKISRNNYLINSYAANIHRMTALLVRFGNPPWEQPEHFEEHKDIFLQVGNGDIEKAKSTLSRHISRMADNADKILVPRPTAGKHENAHTFGTASPFSFESANFS